MIKCLFSIDALVVRCPTWSKNLGRSLFYLLLFVVNWWWSHWCLYLFPLTFTSFGHIITLLVQTVSPKCQLISKYVSYWFLQFFKKTEWKKLDFITKVKLFPFVFFENWRDQKDLSKLTDLYYVNNRIALIKYNVIFNEGFIYPQTDTILNIKYI